MGQKSSQRTKQKSINQVQTSEQLTNRRQTAYDPQFHLKKNIAMTNPAILRRAGEKRIGKELRVPAESLEKENQLRNGEFQKLSKGQGMGGRKGSQLMNSSNINVRRGYGSNDSHLGGAPSQDRYQTKKFPDSKSNSK